MRLKVFHIIFVASLLFISCAPVSEFTYDRPVIPDNTDAGYTLALTFEDNRSQKEIDEVYEKDPVDDIIRITREELYSTGLFKEIIPVPDEKIGDGDYLRNKNVDFIMHSSLRDMKWEVPNYDAMIGITFMVSLFTGGLGGIIYGSTPTDVYGDTMLHMKLAELESGSTVLDKEYTGHYEERMAKLNCDTYKTKASVVGKALKMCMQDMKKDLEDALKKKAEVSAAGSLPERQLIRRKKY